MSSLYSIQSRSEIIGDEFSRSPCPGVSAREEPENRTLFISFAEKFVSKTVPHF